MKITDERSLSFEMVSDVTVLPHRDIFSLLNRFKHNHPEFARELKPVERIPYRINVALVGFKPERGTYPTLEEAVAEIVLLLPTWRFVLPRELLLLHEHVESGCINGSEECLGRTWRDLSWAIPGFMLCQTHGQAFEEMQKPSIYGFGSLGCQRADGSVRFILASRDVAGCGSPNSVQLHQRLSIGRRLRR